jgi:CRP-like cAMP-binding protein
MTLPDMRLVKPLASDGIRLPPKLDHSLSRQAMFSSALVPMFRGRFCDFIVANRKPTIFSKHSVIYDLGDRDRTFFFLRSGFVKIGTITTAGCEVIYDVRKAGDVIGELCVSEQVRPDRAVALEETSAICVPFEEVFQYLLIEPDLVIGLADVFCRAIREAYAQVNSLAADDTVHRVIKVLIGLATKIGRRSGALVEIATYLTQEEIAQMAGARRERVSTALNSLRRRGIVQYSSRGHMVLNAAVFEFHS